MSKPTQRPPGTVEDSGRCHAPQTQPAQAQPGQTLPGQTDTQTTTYLESQLDSLAAAYTVLSRVLHDGLNAEEMAAVTDPEMLAQWPLPARGSTATGLDLLRESRSEGEDYDDVDSDRLRLFVGPARLKAAPYESVYLSREGLLFEDETIAVRRFYRRFGLQVERLNRDPDDHIGLELNFLATLCLRALDALEADDPQAASAFIDGHAQFLDEHLCAWAPQFIERVGEHAQTAFYRGIAHLLEGTLDEAGEFAGRGA